MKKHWNELAKTRLAALGMTQAELSERMGVTQGAMGHWLNGQKILSINQLFLLKTAIDAVFFLLYSKLTYTM